MVYLDSYMILNSPNTRRRQTLVAPTRAETVLMSLANIPDVPALGTVITPRPIADFPDFAYVKRGRRVATDYRHVASIERMSVLYPKIFQGYSEADMFALRQLLRRAWTSTDPREREWLVFLLRKFHAEIISRLQAFQEDPEKMVRERKSRIDYVRENLEKSANPARWLFNVMDSDQVHAARTDGPPPRSEFEDIAFHLQKNLDRALQCPNPECPAPYFFGKEKGQRYCSPDCAQYGQRESKKKWWREHHGKRR